MMIGDFYKKLNILFKTNRNAKTQEARVKVLKSHHKLYEQLRERSDNVDYATKTVGYNPYRKMLNTLTTWILKGSSNHAKDYKNNLKNENPSEIKPNLATNNKIYRGRGNYYTTETIKPTKSELDNQDIKQDVINLKWLRYDLKFKNHNRFKLSKMIRETKDDLDLTIKNARGINHTGRLDNEPTAIPQGRVHEINDVMVKLLAQGYSETEISQKQGVSVATVSRHLHSLVTTHN